MQSNKNVYKRSAVVLTMLLSTSACGSEGREVSQQKDKSEQDSPPSRPAYDPPVQFDAQAGVVIPGQRGAQNALTTGSSFSDPPPIALHGTTSYSPGPSGLVTHDLIRNQPGPVLQTRYPVLPQSGTLGGGASVRPPEVVKVNDQVLVVAPFMVTIPGEGTTPERRAIEVVVADAKTNSVAWTTMLDLPTDRYSGEWSTSSDMIANVVGKHGSSVVIGMNPTNNYAGGDMAWGLDLVTRDVTWSRPDFRAQSVSGDTVVGIVKESVGVRSNLEGIGMSDGIPKWTALADSSDMSVYQSGPSSVAVTGKSYRSYNGFLDIVDTSNGRVISHQERQAHTKCEYDEQSVTVCATPGPYMSQVVAFDANTHEMLWQIQQSDSERIVPDVTKVWHGMVYGNTPNGPVALDARTGQDRNSNVGVAPLVINEHVGIAESDNGFTSSGTLIAYPATK